MKRLATLTATGTLLAALAAGGYAAAEPGHRSPHGPGHGGLDFPAIDADGNGSLSRAELQARAVARIGKADANGDGALDRDELVAAMPGPEGGLAEIFSRSPAEDMADRVLALMGATESGRVEVAALADRRVNMLLAFADEDRNAAISREEAEAMMARAAEREDRHQIGRAHV